MPTAFETWSQFAPQAPVLTAGEEFNVFVSYRSADPVWLINLCDVLRNTGNKLFLDHRELTQDERSTALAHSQVGLIAWSPASADADWMRRTFDRMTQQAAARAFRVVIARMGESQLPDLVSTSTVVDFPLYNAGPGGGEALRLLWALSGQTPAQDAQRFAAEQDTAARDFVEQLKNASKSAGVALADGGAWETSSALASAAATRLVSLGDPDAALLATEKVLQRFPDALRPRQMKAFAHARRGKAGDSRTAQSILKALYDRNERDPETVGVYARTLMDHYNATGNGASLRNAPKIGRPEPAAKSVDRGSDRDARICEEQRR